LATVVVVGGVVAFTVFQKAPGNANSNSSTNVKPSPYTNTVANANVGMNANAGPDADQTMDANIASNSNTPTLPNNWKVYSSLNSELAIFKDLDPAFSASYPPTAYLSEELGGLIVGERPRSEGGPTIEVSRSSTSLSGDLIEACKSRVPWTMQKDRATFDEARLIKISGITSAYVRARLSEFSGNLDPVYVCVPLANGSDIISGQPRDSSFVESNFDAILSSFTLKSSG
jgi:hypothetical protein